MARGRRTLRRRKVRLQANGSTNMSREFTGLLLQKSLIKDKCASSQIETPLMSEVLQSLWRGFTKPQLWIL
jgi:hypothetical protein